MTTNTLDFDQARDRVKECLESYLTSLGLTAKRFPCPIHNGKDANCGIVPGHNLIHCFVCGVTADIFDVAAAKEGKPLSGKGFLTDNLMYLAKRFGIAMPEINLTDDELYELEMRRAYAQAARIVQYSETSAQIKLKLQQYMWPAEGIQKIGIGSVLSYEDYIDRMTKGYGHELKFLMDIDLAGKSAEGKHVQHRIFRPCNLIYPIRDEDGAPIGFSARNLNYESEESAYQHQADSIRSNQQMSEEMKKTAIEKLWRPHKYVNTKTTRIFEKRRTLFNFNEAKKSATKQLAVFEGNADCMTLFFGGIRSAVACCGTAFTQEHLEMALAAGIKKIILIFDPDAAGESATRRFIDVLTQYGDHPGLEVSMILMPEGSGDPDAFVRSFGDIRKGVQEFRKLPQTDLFSWKIKQLVEEGGDPIAVCNDTIPLIINQPNDLFRLAMADRLSLATGVPQEFVRREVLRRIDEGEAALNQNRQLIAAETAKALAKNPSSVDVILATAVAKIEVIDNRKMGYDPTVVARHFQSTVEKMRSTVDVLELVTGYPIFDALMGGIPREGVMVSIPGCPHHGKSILIDNLIIRILKNNPNSQVMMHHVDDASLLRLPRLLGVLSGLPSRNIMKAGASIAREGGAKFEEAYVLAESQMYKWIVDEERLILADQSILDNSLLSLDRWVKQIRRRHHERDMVVVGDNFHLFDLPGYEAGENKVREMSKFISGMPTRHGLTTLFSMEVPKEILRPGVRPKFTDAKNSGGISFDSKVNMGVYQDLVDFADSPLIWTSPNYKERVILPTNEERIIDKPLPIIEVIIDKNKVTGDRKTIYFRLEPGSGRMEECSEAEQVEIREMAFASSASQKKSSAPRSYAENIRAF